MNMKLLIVDDEYEILTWLEEMFRYDFEPSVDVYTASSAYEAIECLNKVSFDVVLTDIKMPGMDGLSLFNHIKANWPRCKTVFLTGYPNFEDMYRIIRHKDVRYILKSEDDEVIQKTVREVLDEQREEFEQEVLRQKQNRNVQRAQALLRENFVDSLIRDQAEFADAGEVKQLAEEAGLCFDPTQAFLMFMVRIDDPPGQEINAVRRSVLLESAGRAILGALPDTVKCHMSETENRWHVGFLQTPAQDEPDHARLFAIESGAVEYAQRLFENTMDGSFSAVIESTPLNYADVSEMFLKMRQILEVMLWQEKNVIVHAEKVSPSHAGEDAEKRIEQVQMLKTYLELHRKRDFFTVLDAVCSALAGYKAHMDPDGLGMYYSVSVLLYQFIDENRLGEHMPSKAELYKLMRADEHKSWREASQYLYSISIELFDALLLPDSALSDLALKRICDYIDSNLSEDLSLTRLADIGGFNASYLSRLFKQHFNVTLSGYVTEKRMKLAARLLRTTGDKIQEISEKTGYLTAQSFARAFKNYFSISAAEYREANRKQSINNK